MFNLIKKYICKLKYIASFIFLLFFFSSGFSQSKSTFFVLFNDKDSSSFSIIQPEKYLSQRAIERRQKQGIVISKKDFPPNPKYVQKLINTGAEPLFLSRWFNGMVLKADSNQLAQIYKFSFVKSIKYSTLQGSANNYSFCGYNSAELETSAFYGKSYLPIRKIGIDSMHANNLTGKGKLVAVLDAGFNKSNQLQAFDSLYKKNNVKATYDFIARNTNVYDDDKHGTQVLSCMASYMPGKLIGGAFNASYILLRTEDNTQENLLEEVYWLLGAEFADSAGADIINSSVGYNTFDNTYNNHTYEQMNGKTTITSLAANYAAAAGMIVVTSAGNFGNDPWKYIIAPADADSILSVGALDETGIRATYSSQGPTSDGRIKPDVVAQGSQIYTVIPDGSIVADNGTSFATPFIASLAAGIWEGQPDLTAQQVIKIIIKSSSQFNNPNNLFGYGFPNYRKIQNIVTTSELKKSDFKLCYVKELCEIKIIDKTNEDYFKIQIFNGFGQILIEKDLSNEKNNFRLNEMEELPSGIYYLRYLDRSHNITIKILN